MESSADYFAEVFQKVVKLIPNCFKRSKETPQWVRGSLEMWLSWYHAILKTRNLSQKVRIYLSMSCRMFGNLIELITQSGNTEFLTEFCSIPLIFKMAVGLCCINLRNIQVLMDILGKFYRILSYIRLSRLCHISLITFLNILKLIVGYTLTIWISLESALRILKILWNVSEGSVFSRLCHLRWSVA